MISLVFSDNELKLLRSCTNDIDIKMDCDKARRGDLEAMSRCATILCRASPSKQRQKTTL